MGKEEKREKEERKKGEKAVYDRKAWLKESKWTEKTEHRHLKNELLLYQYYLNKHLG